MNLIDVIGPIMIGPSSSHTAGAVRLGLLATAILGETPKKAQIFLHGSFAETYKGHGTDMALLAGLMGWLTDDVRIPNAPEIAAETGMEFSFEPIDLGEMTHPNTVYFKIEAADGKKCEIIGSSIGGGQVQITQIDGFPVEITGRLPALLVPHKDVPGVIALVSSKLAAAGINIASMRVFRTDKGGTAFMVIECDQNIQGVLLNEIEALEPVITVKFIASVL